MRFARLAAVLLISGFVTGPALAASLIEVAHPWARPTIPNRPGAVYLVIHNQGDTADRLVGAYADGVEQIEMHRSSQTEGVMRMAPVEAVDLPPGAMVHLDPGGIHLMMFGIASPLVEGKTLEMTLIFESAGELAVSVPITKTMGAEHSDGHQHGATSN